MFRNSARNTLKNMFFCTRKKNKKKFKNKKERIEIDACQKELS